MRYEKFLSWFYSRADSEFESEYMRIVNESNRLHQVSMKGTAFQSRRPRSPVPQSQSGSGSGSSSIAASIMAPLSKLFKSNKSSNANAAAAAQAQAAAVAMPLPPMPAAWQMLPLDVQLPLTCQAFNHRLNQRKNRYMDVVCFDQTRVRLAKLTDRDVLGGQNSASPTTAPSPTPTGSGGETSPGLGSGAGEDGTSGIYQNVPVVTPLLNVSDYIHANHVDGFQRKRAYVCCQGVLTVHCSLFTVYMSSSQYSYDNYILQYSK